MQKPLSLRARHLARHCKEAVKPGRLPHLAMLLLAANMVFAASAAAAPGTPGVPQAPLTIYIENFQNRPGPDPIVKLDAYTGASGQAYTADPNWLTGCNGWIASANQSPTAAGPVADCTTQNIWNQTQRLSWALGLHAGQSQAVAQGNYATSAFTAGNPGAGLVEFQTATNIPFPTSNRFVSFSVDVSAVNCGASAPLLQFSLVDDGGTATPAGSQINACTSGTTYSVPAVGGAAAGDINAGTYASNGAVLISGASVGVRMVNNNGSGTGNDHAFDNISILDTTPQLDKSFSPTNQAVGGASTLTFTITNTDELGAKNGWSFTDTLPSGLTVASDEIATDCPAGVVTAPVGGSTISVSGNLTAGLASCTATVPVTATTPGTYTNDASNITSAVGVNPPGSSSVTFGTQPNFVCNANMYMAQNTSAPPTTLYQFDTSNNPFVFNSLGTEAGHAYNAIAFNPADNYLYGMSTNGTQALLLRIGSDGQATNLGVVSGGGINAAPPGTIYNNGEIAPDGSYYVYAGASSTLFRINISTRVATAIPMSQAPGGADIAWYNGLLYTQDGAGQLFSINPNTGAVAAIGTPQTPRTFGAMFGASNGVFGGSNSGGFYRVNLTTGATTLISSSPGAANNDGAKCVTTALTFPADTQITKTDSSQTYTPGTDVVYTIVVSNNGPFGVQGAAVNDPLPAGITQANWTCGSPTNGGVCGTASGTGAISGQTVDLPAGASVTYTLTMTVPADFTADLINTATVTNPADSSDPDTGNNSSTDTNDPAAPAMTIEKTGTLNDLDGDGLIDLGETISYSFLVTNTGNVTLTGVTVNDPLVTVNQGPQTLAPGGSFTFTASYTPTQADINAGSVENTATGTGTPPSSPPIESPPDTVIVPPDQAPGLVIEKTGTLNDLDGDGLIDLGETIDYAFLVTNTGTVTMTNVTVNDPLVTVDQGPQTLAPGASFTFTATYTPTQADIDNGSVTNTATGTGTDPNGDTTESPPDTVTVPPDQTPGLTIVKTGTLNDLDGDDLLDPGETISYSFLVTNTGTVTQANVTVNDPLVTVDQGPQTLAPGGRFTFTATYTPTQADIDNGSVTNTATGTGTDPGGGTTESPPDTVIVPPDQTPGLTIVKTGTLNDLDDDDLLDAGETISYLFLVRNTGNVTLTGVTVNDPLVTVDQGPQTLAPGGLFTFTATYTPTQADVDAGAVVNTATGSGTDPNGGTIESPPDTVIVPPSPTNLAVEKVGVFNDVDGDGYASVGDTLTYTFTITNEGGQTAADVWPQDPGPTFNGRPAANDLSRFEPGPVVLAPGQSQAFTATYVLDQSDIDNAAGVADGLENSARAQGSFNGINVPSNTSTSVITMPAATPGDISIAKVALLRHIRRGEQAPFAITITNNSMAVAGGMTVVDTLPSGFRFVEGSASINGVAATPVVEGLRVIFENVTVPAESQVEIRLRMLALSSAGPGEHVNRASVTDSVGRPLAPDATATVEILVEPVFDCGDIIGKVFDDENRNGYQDQGELGLPGVRVATVNGWLVTTDAHGRFHVPCAALPDQRIGSNFIMKVDSRTLPTGYRLTTENPRVVRLTAGKMTELNFGASIGRIVRLDLQDAAFEPGQLELRQQWAEGIDELIAFLAVEQSVLRLTYIEAGADPELAGERLQHLSDLIGDRWRQTSGQYRLDIETRVETGK